MTSDRWAWLENSDIWTLGVGLVTILLSGIIIDRNAEESKHFWLGWLLRRSKKTVAVNNQGGRNVMEDQGRSDSTVRSSVNSATLVKHGQDDNNAQFVACRQSYKYLFDQSEISADPLRSSDAASLVCRGWDNDGISTESQCGSILSDENVNCVSDDVLLSRESDATSEHIYLKGSDDCVDSCWGQSENPMYSCAGHRKLQENESAMLCTLSKLKVPRNTLTHRHESVEKKLNLPEERTNVLSDMTERDFNASSNACSLHKGSTRDVFNCWSNTPPVRSTCLNRTRNETTQTDSPAVQWLTLSSSRGTNTDSFTTDSSVSTHATPCRLVRHYSTSTTGPFMKKLRRAQRLLAEARETSRCDQASSAARWRRVLNRYRHKMVTLTSHMTQKDVMMGGTSSRINVLRGEIKDALLAVRSSTSTRERLTTQCKLNAALMDVIESKSENPTYGADMDDQHGGGLKQDQRGPQ